MQRVITTFTLLLLALGLWAAPVNEETTQLVARNCLEAALESRGLPVKDALQLVLSERQTGLIDGATVDLYHVYTVADGQGWAIVAADDRVLPVLGYSPGGAYLSVAQEQPEAFRKWMEYYRQQILSVIREEFSADATIENTWAKYLAGNIDKDLLTVNPLLTTTWDQPFPYNALCPQDPGSGQRAVVGCVATAMAQVMRYHAHPAQGTGFHSYNHPQFGTISANFGGSSYNWANMPNSISNYNEAVALLSFHCGVSVEMGYGVDVSGVSSLSFVADALKNYFSYANTTTFVERENYGDADWIALMKAELDNSRPVEYGGIGQGGGHAWVMDGYDTGNFFHMNWGWSGFQDGYFTLDALNPNTGGTGAGNSGYNYYQQAVIGVVPATGGGGGGGGAPDPTEYNNLAVYSPVTANPYPLQFAQPFEITVDIANLGNQNVTGDIAAAIFTLDGTFLDFVDELSGTLENGFFYTLTFENEGLPTSPGEYQLGFFYRPTNGQYTLIPAGDYANPVTFEIEGPANDISLYSAITPSPGLITVNQPFTITVDYANFGFSDYSGDFSVDLYTLEGDYVQELAMRTENLCANCHFTNGLTFSSNGIDVEPGSYLIATWNRPAGGDWQIVATGEFQNPIQVQVQAPAIQPDPFENNNSIANAYNVNPVFSGNGFSFTTAGTNMHQAEDADYFRVDLAPGYSYSVIARAHDSYNSGNGQTYTNDVAFALGDGVLWSNLYDDLMDGPITFMGGESVYLSVSSYFVGTLGSYQLDVQITRTPTTDIAELGPETHITLGPNPSQGQFNLSMDLERNADVEARVISLTGQELARFHYGNGAQLNETLDLRHLPSGSYLLLLQVDGKQYHQRIVISH